MKTFNVRVEYESAPIRHIAVQCPECKKWFYGRDLTEDNLEYEHEISNARYGCPICGCDFGYVPYGVYIGDYIKVLQMLPHIEELGGADKVYKDCVEKKVIWE